MPKQAGEICPFKKSWAVVWRGFGRRQSGVLRPKGDRTWQWADWQGTRERHVNRRAREAFC